MTSPFNRSSTTRRTPPSTPVPVPVSEPEPESQEEDVSYVCTAEIQNFLTKIEQNLNEVCTIAGEGKLNSDQKLRINRLCRNICLGTSQMVVQYQSIKQKAIVAHTTINALKEKIDLEKCLTEMKTTLQTCSSPSQPVPIVSFADMVKKSADNFVRPVRHNAVAIYPRDKLKTSEDTKKLVQTIIRPEEMKLHVKGVRKTKNGGVIISTDSQEDLEKLKRSSQLTNSGLTIEEPSKRNPRLIILGVPSALTDKEFFDCLYEQNLADKLSSESQENIMASIKLSHKSGKKNSESCNYIIEVPPSIRKILINQQ